jgi:two-component system sensor histidine kinase RegB
MDGSSRTPWYLGATAVVTVPWLIRMRVITAVIEVAAVIVAWTLPALDLPLDHLAPLLIASAIAHAGSAWMLSRSRPMSATVATLAMLVDVVLLTGLLELTGGPLNPFSLFYGVHIALAALTLGRVAALLAAATAAAGYGVLVYWHLHELVPGHHRLNDFPTHLFTMWLAAEATAELAAWFVVRASNALALREHELAVLRAQAARTERVVALTTLAAGAAHELSTPLATIALAARELERTASAQGAEALTDDARLIRAEVDRCRAILDHMSGRAGGAAAEVPEPVAVDTLLNDIVARLPAEQSSRVRVVASVRRPLTVPRAGLAQALSSLIKNAFDASDAVAAVTISAVEQNDNVLIAVTDTGAGFSEEGLKRAGEPFYTTKPPGRGLGLGLFLARIFAERAGGTLRLDSRNGTTATLDLPVAGTPMESAS